MKNFKKIIVTLLCLVMALGVAACRDGASEADTVTYTVTVKAGSGMTKLELQSAIKVKLVDSAGTQTIEQGLSGVTDENLQGVATFTVTKGEYTVSISGVKAGFYTHGNLTLTPTAPNTTITIDNVKPEAPSVTYQVQFTLSDGTPVANTGVQICGVGEGGQCHATTTNENGMASWQLPAAEYEVHVPEENWPSGYVFDDTEYKLSVTTKELTATFKKPTVFKAEFYLADPAKYNGTDCEKGDAAANIAFSLYSRNESTDTLGSKIGSFTANDEGKAEFTAFIPSGCIGEIQIDSEGYMLGYDSNKMFVNGDTDVHEVIVHIPGAYAYAPIELTNEATVDASKMTWYQFTPKQSGVYEISATSSVPTAVQAYNFNSGNIWLNNDITQSDDADDNVTFTKTGNNFKFTINVGQSYIGTGYPNRYLLYCGGSTTDTFTLSLNRTEDYAEAADGKSIPVNAEHILTSDQMPAASGTFTLLSPTEVVVKGDDGFYRLTNKNGAIIFVTLGNKYNIDDMNGQNLLTNFYDGCHPKSDDPDENLEPLTLDLKNADGNTYVYNDFYASYVEGCNADGLHPLNDELQLFLERFYDRSGYAVMLKDTTKENEPKYYYACGYYKEA